MKKYYEYLNEIYEEDLYEGLLGYGLFTDKLPPIFTSVHFFEHCFQLFVSEMQKSCTRKEIINKDYTLDYIIIPWFIR